MEVARNFACGTRTLARKDEEKLETHTQQRVWDTHTFEVVETVKRRRAAALQNEDVQGIFADRGESNSLGAVCA